MGMFCFKVDFQIFRQSFHNLVRAQTFFRGFGSLAPKLVKHIAVPHNACVIFQAEPVNYNIWKADSGPKGEAKHGGI